MVIQTLVLVIPVYNEGKRLTKSVGRLVECLDTIRINNGISYKIVIALDCGSDDSLEIATELAAQYHDVELLVEENKRGRGHAVREAWFSYDADIYAFIDADLATGTDIILKSLETFMSTGCDLVISSRYLPDSVVHRPPLRRFISYEYNRILRLVFKSHIMDFQCGYKAIRASVRNELLKFTTEDSWFWDTELVVLAEKFGFIVKELPVFWREEKYRRTYLRRLLNDVYLHGTGILSLVGRVNSDLRTYNRLRER